MHHRQKSRRPRLALIIACAGLAWLSFALPAAAQTGTALPKSGSHIAGNERFKTVAAAAQHCPGGTVVWTNFSKSKVFHLSDSKYYGKTKHGAYVCEQDAVSAGYHASKR